jgi:hypothetical protein
MMLMLLRLPFWIGVVARQRRRRRRKVGWKKKTMPWRNGGAGGQKWGRRGRRVARRGVLLGWSFVRTRTRRRRRDDGGRSGFSCWAGRPA